MAGESDSQGQRVAKRQKVDMGHMPRFGLRLRQSCPKTDCWPGFLSRKLFANSLLNRVAQSF